MTGLLSVAAGTARPLGSVVASEGTPPLLVMTTALLTGVMPDTAVPVAE